MKVGGRDFNETREAVERTMRDVEPESIQKHAVEINGQNYPPKQVLATVTGWERISFTTMEAQRVLGKLGFHSFDVTVMRTGRREFIPLAPDVGSPDEDVDLGRLAALEAALATAQEAIAGLAVRVRALEAR